MNLVIEVIFVLKNNLMFMFEKGEFLYHSWTYNFLIFCCNHASFVTRFKIKGVWGELVHPIPIKVCVAWLKLLFVPCSIVISQSPHGICSSTIMFISSMWGSSLIVDSLVIPHWLLWFFSYKNIATFLA
jgi:hypothetical protein